MAATDGRACDVTSTRLAAATASSPLVSRAFNFFGVFLAEDVHESAIHVVRFVARPIVHLNVLNCKKTRQDQLNIKLRTYNTKTETKCCVTH